MIKAFFRKRNRSEAACELRNEKDDYPVMGVIMYINLNENVLRVFADEAVIGKHFEVGDKVRVKLLRDGKEFNFYGKIALKNISDLEKSLTVDIEEVRVFSNLRRSERFHYKCKVRVCDAKGNVSEGTIMDIGIGGAMIILESEVNTETDIRVSVFPHNRAQITFGAETIRSIISENCHRYALKIKEIDKENRKGLNELITLLSLEKSKLVNEWESVKATNIKVSMIMNRPRI